MVIVEIEGEQTLVARDPQGGFGIYDPRSTSGITQKLVGNGTENEPFEYPSDAHPSRGGVKSKYSHDYLTILDVPVEASLHKYIDGKTLRSVVSGNATYFQHEIFHYINGPVWVDVGKYNGRYVLLDSKGYIINNRGGYWQAEQNGPKIKADRHYENTRTIDYIDIAESESELDPNSDSDIEVSPKQSSLAKKAKSNDNTDEQQPSSSRPDTSIPIVATRTTKTPTEVVTLDSDSDSDIEVVTIDTDSDSEAGPSQNKRSKTDDGGDSPQAGPSRPDTSKPVGTQPIKQEPIGDDDIMFEKAKFGETQQMALKAETGEIVNPNYASPAYLSRKHIPDNLAPILIDQHGKNIGFTISALWNIQFYNQEVKDVITSLFGGDQIKSLQRDLMNYFNLDDQARADYLSGLMKSFTIPDDDPRVGLRGQKGVKANKPIEKGALIGTYSGRYVPDGSEIAPLLDSGAPMLYTFDPKMSRGGNITAYGAGEGNVTTRINANTTHGLVENEVPQEANVMFSVVRVYADDGQSYNIPIVIALRDIAPGEELLVDYGHEYWQALGRGVNAE